MDAIREKVAKKIETGDIKPKLFDLIREFIELNAKLANNKDRDPKNPDWIRYKALTGLVYRDNAGVV